jgi:hypothetical protein
LGAGAGLGSSVGGNTRAVRHAELRGFRAIGAHLFILVAHNRLAVFLQRRDPLWISVQWVLLK